MKQYFVDLFWTIFVAGVVFAGWVMDSMGVAVVALLAVFVYILPYVVASFRGHQNTQAIAAVNILLGWTFLGWVFSLVWALTEVKAPQPQAQQSISTEQLVALMKTMAEKQGKE